MAASANAQTLDQAYFASSANGLIVSSEQTLSQTFTVGRSERLNRVDVQVARNPEAPTENLIMEIRSTLSDGSPSLNVLAAASLPPEAIPFSTTNQYVPFDFLPARLDLTAGEVLAIVLRTDAVATGGNVNPYAWTADTPANYARGQVYIAHPPATPSFSASDYSLGFKTYTSVVPAPSALLTALMGVFPGAALLLRRRRRK